jgi:hypothetical protein
MICSAKLVVTEDLCVEQKEEFKFTLDERPSIVIRDKPIFSSERMLHKEYYRRSSVENKSGRGSQGA